MNHFFKRIKSYYTFSKTDLRGLLILTFVIFCLLAGPVLLNYFLNGGTTQLEFEKIQGLKGSLDSTNSHVMNKNEFKTEPAPSLTHASTLNHSSTLTKQRMFTFDPNTADSMSWNKTGLPVWKIKMICHYLQKGGHFRSVEEVRKIYCLTDSDYNQVKPFLVINPSSSWNNNYRSKSGSHENWSKNYNPWSKNYKPWNNNYKPWNNNYLPDNKRNNAYSNKYEGPGNSKINLNAADYIDLKQLRDLSYHDIKVILDYKKRNGDFTDIRELKNIGLIDERTFRRIRPFICL